MDLGGEVSTNKRRSVEVINDRVGKWGLDALTENEIACIAYLLMANDER